MASSDNSAGRAVSTRELSLAVGRSYEQCRLVLAGRPVASREFNDAACRFLSLNADEMWWLATVEKARKRYGTTESQLTVPPDNRLLRAWTALAEEDRERLVRIAEKLAKRNRKKGQQDELIQLIIID